MGVDLIIEHAAWDETDLAHLAPQAFAATAQVFGWSEEAYEVALLACDDARIAVLNADFRGKPTPTNVLSWPAEDYSAPTTAPNDPELGDIALAYETCVREAADQGKAFDHHICHLIVHGLLHLLGFDHETEQDAARMERTEVDILAKMGIPDPY
ncbi:MAG: rRNA maturation RNase YbeY [Pseudomonadota bacterium]